MGKRAITTTQHLKNNYLQKNNRTNNLYFTDITGLNSFSSDLKPSKKASLIIKSHNLKTLNKNKQKYLLQIHSNNNLTHSGFCLDTAINQYERLSSLNMIKLKKKLKH